ncbi:MAG: tRNA (adenosine(37)-N6)-dimethylallyltransferase MiaA [Alphaproteobacteria bacterium]
MSKKILIIAGATASGKSAHALSVAAHCDGVIINADSQQLYRDLPILTARPTEAEQAGIPHKLYGILGADEQASAGKWLRFAKMEIDWAHSQGLAPMVVGGTGLYIKTLMEGIAEVPEIDEAVRQQAANDYEAMGKEAFSERLRAVDPEFFERLKVYDRQRLLRAYEVWLGTGKSLSWWQGRGNVRPYPDAEFEVIKVELPREEIYRRCDARFLKMIEQGAVEEVRSLFFTSPLMGEVAECSDLGGGESIASNTPSLPLPHQGGGNLRKIIGVTEILAYLRGDQSLNQSVKMAQQMTRNYAKRQLTWLRNQL